MDEPDPVGETDCSWGLLLGRSLRESSLSPQKVESWSSRWPPSLTGREPAGEWSQWNKAEPAERLCLRIQPLLILVSLLQPPYVLGQFQVSLYWGSATKESFPMYDPTITLHFINEFLYLKKWMSHTFFLRFRKHWYSRIWWVGSILGHFYMGVLLREHASICSAHA